MSLFSVYKEEAFCATINGFSPRPIQKFIARFSGPILVSLIAMAMVGGAFTAFSGARAEDAVCGDGVKQGAEQCDDGDLVSGDGCSASCTIEVCGNAIVDIAEQCDDGNTNSGDGCGASCTIEFCGDSIVSGGEQCDDGNGLSGDGCSKTCVVEIISNPADTDTLKTAAPDEPSSVLPVTPPAVPYTVVLQAKQGLSFLGTPDGEDYLQYLSREEGLELETILKKLGSGRRLTKEEREWAAALYTKILDAVGKERTRYTDLLKQFISTPISGDVVDEKSLDKTRLVDVEVPIAIDELEAAVQVIRRGDLQSQVGADLSRLKRQGIDLAAMFPVDPVEALKAGARPIEVFATLKGLKEAAESHATNDVPASLQKIRAEALALKAAIPVFEREYGLKPADTEPLLAAIDTVAGEVDRKDLDRVVAAVNRFLGVLERAGVIEQGDLAMTDVLHGAAPDVARIAEATGKRAPTAKNIDTFIESAAKKAPDSARPAFEEGDAVKQRVELLQLLEHDEQLHELRAAARELGRTEFDFSYVELRAAIGRVGTEDDPATVCDDSMQSALGCTEAYLRSLQDAVRGKSLFTRIIGRIQDFFGIGS